LFFAFAPSTPLQQNVRSKDVRDIAAFASSLVGKL
jgi:hypothetical protein